MMTSSRVSGHKKLTKKDGTGLRGGSGQRPGTGDQTGRLGPFFSDGDVEDLGWAEATG